MVVLNKVSKKYKDLLALNNVSFEINKGEVFGYISNFTPSLSFYSDYGLSP